MPRSSVRLPIPPSFAVVLVLVACTADKAPGDDSGQAGSDIEVFDVQVELAPAVPTVARVTWRTEQPTTGTVEFWHEDDEPRWVRGADRPSTEHEAWLVGVPEQTDASFTVHASDEHGEVTSGPYSYTTGSLPASVPRPVLERDTDPDNFGGISLLPVASGPERWATLLDREGRLLWAWGGLELDTQRARLTQDGRGIIMMDRWPGITGTDLIRVDFDGVEQWRLEIPNGHHDFALVDDETFLVLRSTWRTVEVGGEERNLIGDEVVQIELAGGERVIWSVWDHFVPTADDPMELVGDMTSWDWSHGNFLSYQAETDEIHMTLRNLHVATGIQRSSAEVLWTLRSDHEQGGALDFPHSVWPTTRGLLVFNQRNFNSGDCSSVTELDGAPADTTPDISWAYEGPYCSGVYYVGNAQPLPEDHVMVSWGSSSAIEEIAQADTEASWRLSYPPQTWVLYVERLLSLGRPPG